MSDLGIIGYGLFASVASHKQFISYGDAWHHLVDRYGFSCGASEPGNGRQWCREYVQPMCTGSAEINRMHGEPVLASLCRRFDGRIGEGYLTAVGIRYGAAAAARLTTDAAIQAHANAEAARCWAFFGLT
jgi:hypothetical protein